MTTTPEPSSDDPRAVRSRQRLGEALVRVLAREDLSSIGVAELCREAGVHRTTFYGHYDSVGELAADVYASMIDEAATASPRPGDRPDAISRAYLDATVSLLRAIARDRQAIRSLLDSPVSLGFRKRLRSHFLRKAASAISVIRDSGVDLPENTDVGAAYVAGGIVSAIELWASVDGDDAEAFAQRIFANMPRWWPAPSA
ncbi:TetR/AcrR family transcriptional regulator [Microbacterium karelineae]|uniref:TetR/AcrR family transcriptional regulator n=1 Tax=Microbacterium karelineae TaxID=2654283 RepID=UPI0012EA0EE2|nr:TetR/AcrR family transcriptional regulator [Microbacterium karelineae]